MDKINIIKLGIPKISVNGVKPNKLHGTYVKTSYLNRDLVSFSGGLNTNSFEKFIEGFKNRYSSKDIDLIKKMYNKNSKVTEMALNSYYKDAFGNIKPRYDLEEISNFVDYSVTDPELVRKILQRYYKK